MGLGILAFILAVISFAITKVKQSNQVSSKRHGVIYSFFKFVIFAAFLPLVLLIQIIKPKETLNLIRQKKLFKAFSIKTLIIKIFALVLVSGAFALWIAGYSVVGILLQSQLGYLPESAPIVGTGSMYPTWPKGTKGKDPKELGKEIVSSAGFLPYPNGLVLGGQRYFDHKISRGDIVTAQNDAIGKVTEKTYGTPSGVLKRVIALGGDTIELKDGIVYLNNSPLKEQYIAKPHSTFGEEFLKECQKYTVPNDSAFLMGDNRKGSGDSREFGPVKYSEIKSILPLSKQKGTLDKNWHDATNDLADVAKPTIDRNRFVELLNQKRKENGASPVKYEPKLEVSAKTRGEYMLTHDSLEKEVSYDTIVNAMSKAGYWNSYVWEWRIEGYYEADELIEDYLERDSTDAKNVWFDKKFDDIGIAEVQGTLNGCPTQIIVVHAAGYIPPNYKQSDIDSWQPSLDGLKNIQSGWADLKNNGSFYSQHKADVDRINEIISTRISRIESIVSTMKANKWLSSEQNKWISEDLGLFNEQEALANKLNGK
jgi:signal peptidase I